MNVATTSTTQCSNYYKCICKPKTCINCTSGTYQDEKGSTTCKTCASGTYNTEQGQTTKSSCKTCEQGYKCTSGNKHICPSGTYQDETGSTTCKTCAPGTYNTEQGQISCKTCDQGYSCKDANKTEQICPSGKYQDETGSTTCKNCDAGKHELGGEGKTSENEACAKCDPGLVSTKGQAQCTACIANTYTTDGVLPCKKCSSSQVSPPNSTRCYDIANMLQNVQSLSAQQGGIIKSLALSNAKSNEVKQKANGLIAKLSLNWATQDVINEAQILRDQLSKLP